MKPRFFCWKLNRNFCKEENQEATAYPYVFSWVYSLLPNDNNTTSSSNNTIMECLRSSAR